MTEKDFHAGFAKMSGREINRIIYAVNCKVTMDELDLKTDVEKEAYKRFWAEAEAHEKKYGFWPVFEMAEIESDDPCLDIYNNAP